MAEVPAVHGNSFFKGQALRHSPHKALLFSTTNLAVPVRNFRICVTKCG